MIHFAAAGGSEALVLLLCEHGADLLIRDDYALSPVHYAVMYNHEPVVKWLWAKGAKMDAKTFSYLVQTELTPLHIAAEKGYIGIASFLLLSGVDINVIDNQGVL